jgi:hypothetical protein
MAILLQVQHILKFRRDEYMKTRLIIIQLIVIVAGTFPGICQTAHNRIDLDKINPDRPLAGELYSPSSAPDIVTYFNRNWSMGDIWLTDGTMVRNKKIRYNGLLDELFWQEPVSNQTIKLDKGAVLRFHFQDLMGDTSVYFSKLKVKQNILADSLEIFGEEIYRGDLSLYILNTI